MVAGYPAAPTVRAPRAMVDSREIDRSACRATQHGTATAKHNHGCSCPDAALAKYLQVKRRRTGRAPARFVPVTGTQRRLRALQAAGWSGARLAEMLGVTKAQVAYYADDRPVEVSTHRRVLDLYERLSRIAPPDDMSARRTRAHARAHGWARPEHWDPRELDDPRAVSDLAAARPPRPLLAWDDIAELQQLLAPLALDDAERDRRIAERLGSTVDAVQTCRRRALRARGKDAKLTDDDIVTIRARFLDEVLGKGQLSRGELAEAYGIGKSQMTHILSGKARPHLDLPDIRSGTPRPLAEDERKRTTSPIPTNRDGASPGADASTTEVAA